MEGGEGREAKYNPLKILHDLKTEGRWGGGRENSDKLKRSVLVGAPLLREG